MYASQPSSYDTITIQYKLHLRNELFYENHLYHLCLHTEYVLRPSFFFFSTLSVDCRFALLLSSLFLCVTANCTKTISEVFVFQAQRKREHFVNCTQ